MTLFAVFRLLVILLVAVLNQTPLNAIQRVHSAQCHDITEESQCQSDCNWVLSANPTLDCIGPQTSRQCECMIESCLSRSVYNLDVIILVDGSCPMSINECEQQQQDVAMTMASISGGQSSGPEADSPIRVGYMEYGSMDINNIVDLSHTPLDMTNEILSDLASYDFYHMITRSSICDNLSQRNGDPNLHDAIAGAINLFHDSQPRTDGTQSDKQLLIFSNCGVNVSERNRICEEYENDIRSGINIVIVNNKLNTRTMIEPQSYIMCLVEYDPNKVFVVQTDDDYRDILPQLQTEICKNPTSAPTADPTQIHIISETTWLSDVTNATIQPTQHTTIQPTQHTTIQPTQHTTIQPTQHPTNHPAKNPTLNPTVQPTQTPSTFPSIHTTKEPTIYPTQSPSTTPTIEPRLLQTTNQTIDQTQSPTKYPITHPSNKATTMEPTQNPGFVINTTMKPTLHPFVEIESTTEFPSRHPTIESTTNATIYSTQNPSNNDSTIEPTVEPTTEPTTNPTLCDIECINATNNIDIEIMFSFNSNVDHNLNNMQCVLYQMFSVWFENFEFCIDDIIITQVIGGISNNELCDIGPCFSITNDSVHSRQLLQIIDLYDGNATYILTANSDIIAFVHNIENEIISQCEEFYKEFDIALLQLMVYNIIEEQTQSLVLNTTTHGHITTSELNLFVISSSSEETKFIGLWILLGILGSGCVFVVIILCIRRYKYHDDVRAAYRSAQHNVSITDDEELSFSDPEAQNFV